MKVTVLFDTQSDTDAFYTNFLSNMPDTVSAVSVNLKNSSVDIFVRDIGVSEEKVLLNELKQHLRDAGMNHEIRIEHA